MLRSKAMARYKPYIKVTGCLCVDLHIYCLFVSTEEIMLFGDFFVINILLIKLPNIKCYLRQGENFKIFLNNNKFIFVICTVHRRWEVVTLCWAH